MASRLSSGVTQIFSTSSAFAALKSDGSIVTWGDSRWGGDSSGVSSRLSSGVVSFADPFNDDLLVPLSPTPTITLAVAPTTVTEDGTSNLIYTFTRTGVTSNALTVNYTVGGTATIGTDYTGIATAGTTKTVTFAANSSIATVTVDPTTDSTVESDETVALTLASGTGYTIGTTNAVTGTITNDDPFTGTSNADTLIGTTGADTLIGLAGNDTYTVNHVGDIVTEALNEGTDLVNASISYTLTNHVENLTLTGTTAINGTGNTGNNTLTGNTGNNILVGGDGNDTLNGGAGTDTLIGGTGNDIYVVDTTTDTITENANEGTDTIQSSVTFTIASLTNIENLTLTGTTAINGTGNAGNNTLTGNTGNNILVGGDGNDTLNGRAGTDTLIGGTGNDIYVVDTTTDTITENANEGTDTIQSSVTFTIASLTNIENLTLTGTTAINGTGNAGNNTLTGNTGNNILVGGDGNDTLNGRAGTDTLIGGTGNDIYVVDTTTDTITENANEGTDIIQSSITFDLTVFPNIENLTLTGIAAINGTGNAGSNSLTGNSGNNILNGGAGRDTLRGGTGSDTFVFQFGQSPVSGADRITDFAIGTDKIDLLTASGGVLAAPTSFTRAANSTATTLTNVVNSVFIDADGGVTGNQALGVNSAALVSVSTSGIAGTYLVMNDGVAGFQASNDLLVNITGFTGTLPALGSITVSNFFI
ncbi:beta strand repeat-containing protein [Sphaerospermopsis aphanizomenoides]|uniref:beta strand repeat-containing protein n=1 Tax=Sphaerospermopsis aphanizomenoides TaxID=459663 RepID=UPI002AD2C4B5|nr:calcium-binding protein [Sphaerospermopsis aphanizomenoides]